MKNNVVSPTENTTVIQRTSIHRFPNSYEDSLFIDNIDDVLYVKVNGQFYGGYKPIYFMNEHESKKINVCSNCNGIVRDPYHVSVSQCDHIFCKLCLDNLSSCPEDGTVLKHVKIEKHKKLESYISQRKVNCPLSQRGCGWRGKLSEVTGHIKRCNNLHIICEKECGVVYPRFAKQQHDENCGAKEMVCKYCGEAMLGKALKLHQAKICDNFPLECPHGCSKGSVPRIEYEDHINIKCPAMIVQCPFLQHGCYTALMRQDLDAHMSVEQRKHITLLAEKLGEVEKENELHKMTIEEMKSELSIQRSFNVQIQNELQLIHDNFEALYLQGAVLPVDADSNNGMLIWHISMVRKKINNKQFRHTSKGFYSGPKGYKFVIDFDSMADPENPEDNVISAHARCVKGLYDLMLIWPFTGEITFSILNPYEDKNHFSKVLVLDNTTNFDRPCQENNEFRLGFDFFIEESIVCKEFMRYGGIYLKAEVRSNYSIPKWLI